MKHSIIVILILSWNALRAQDNVKQVIEKVFYEKKVSAIVFFNYKGEGEWPYRWPDGISAFILPDTTFEKIYPNILFEVASSWGVERKLNLSTYIKTNDRIVFITNSILDDETIRLYVRFDLIKITETKASLVFHTTSWSYHTEMNKRYVKVNVELRKHKKDWKVIDLTIKNHPCCDILYPEFQETNKK